MVVADDSALVRRKLCGALSEVHSIEIVAEAQDAAQAIEAVAHYHPAAIILDLQMPEGGGLAVLSSFQMAPCRPLSIVLTNYSSAGFRKCCMEAGADFFLDKSTEFEKIIPLLKQWDAAKRVVAASSNTVESKK